MMVKPMGPNCILDCEYCDCVRGDLAEDHEAEMRVMMARR